LTFNTSFFITIISTSFNTDNNLIKTNHMERRKFIKTATIVSTAMASSFYTSGITQQRKIKIGLIGAGWYGMVITKSALIVGGVEVIGVCDVDSSHLNDSATEIEKLQGSRPKTFKYYQELLDMKGLEAIFIGTPPQWHALQFIAACEKGLDIYCEKPLAYDIQEGLAMIKAAQKAGNIVQIGFQRRQNDSYLKAKEFIAAGRIGNVQQISAQIHYVPAIADTTIQAPPATLDWDEWCGPAPMLPYRPSIGHKSWRLEKEYGNGHLVDWGIHLIDIIRKIMDETMPTEFYTKAGIFELKNQITTPDTLTANMAFAKAPIVWQHRLWGVGDTNKDFNNGILFHGSKSTLFVSDSKIMIFEGGKERQTEEIVLTTKDAQERHVGNFLTAVRNKDKSLIKCTPEDAFQSTATVQLAMISHYSQSLVKWDSTKNEIVNNKTAMALTQRAYREKYKHP